MLVAVKVEGGRRWKGVGRDWRDEVGRDCWLLSPRFFGYIRIIFLFIQAVTAAHSTHHHTHAAGRLVHCLWKFIYFLEADETLDRGGLGDWGGKVVKRNWIGGLGLWVIPNNEIPVLVINSTWQRDAPAQPASPPPSQNAPRSRHLDLVVQPRVVTYVGVPN